MIINQTPRLNFFSSLYPKCSRIFQFWNNKEIKDKSKCEKPVLKDDFSKGSCVDK